MVSQIAVTNQKQGDFMLLAEISLIHNEYMTGYGSAASFCCQKYSEKHSATFKTLYILTFHYIHEKLCTHLGAPKIINGGPFTVDNFRDASN